MQNFHSCCPSPELQTLNMSAQYTLNFTEQREKVVIVDIDIMHHCVINNLSDALGRSQWFVF